MRLCSIASGSAGNCIYVGSDCTHILLDAGISAKRVEEGLKSLEINPKELDAILVTHEHSDHIQGLGVLARKYGIPIYATKGTVEGIRQTCSVGKIDEALFNTVSSDCRFYVKDVCVTPFSISHDAKEPVGYTFKCDGKKAAVATDLGTYNDYILDKISNCDVLMAEANHDIHMLQVGPYPYYLKQRILSDHGHLSNENCGRMISEALHDGVKHIVLGHLSKENNYPDLAYETVRLEIEASDTPYHGNDFPLTVAKRDMPISIIEY